MVNPLVKRFYHNEVPIFAKTDGICHVYVDKSADSEMARRIVLEAKIDYPVGCNAMETLLVHKDLIENGWLNNIVVELRTEDGNVSHFLLCGSAHTDSTVAEDHEVADVFLRQVDSAAIFHNASTRFCDGARFGLGAEVGISTSRIHARGLVGVEGLLTNRWILKGSGQIVDGDKAVSYIHRDLAI
ncbi:hypothetical protein VNO77_43659 [Canavalia gladiata]|uniref:Uncharacterized protein n=1 Tax=Canavalia gladiata TaxID=3824 RepID=A0AAN9PPM3_CANGL